MIHKLSDVQSNKVGDNTLIWQYCVVLKGAKIGSHTNINCNVFIENDVVIGDHVTVKPGVQLWDGLRVDNYVFIGPNVTFTNDATPRSKQYPDQFSKTSIQEGASIGANATILSGITVGCYSMIGAGSVLTKSTDPFTLWYGNPAIHKGYVTLQGNIISMDLKDKNGIEYYISKSGEPLVND